MTQAFRELVQIGITLTSEQDLGTLLERILTEARRFTRAEAGTLFLREGDQLRFSVVQNDKLARELGQEEMRRRLQADPLSLRELSLAGRRRAPQCPAGGPFLQGRADGRVQPSVLHDPDGGRVQAPLPLR